MQYEWNPNQHPKPYHSLRVKHFQPIIVAAVSVALAASGYAVQAGQHARLELSSLAGTSTIQATHGDVIADQQEGLQKARNAANEAAAIARVRTLATLEMIYSTKYQKGYAPDLATLGPDAAGKCHNDDDGSASHACMIDATLGCASGTSGAWCTKGGFRYSITGVCKKGVCDDFVIRATPADPSNGNRNFCATSEGESRAQIGPPLTSPMSVSECQSWEPAVIDTSNLMNPKMINEAEAAHTVRSVITDELRYSNSYPEKDYAPDFASLGLGPDGKCQAGHACFAAGIFGCTSGTSREWCTKGGFRYTITATCRKGSCHDFVVVGTPVDSSQGMRSFCGTSDDGVVRGQTGPPLKSAISVSECQSWKPL